MTHCGGSECDGEPTCTCDCERCGITQVADDGIVIDHVVPEAARSTTRLDVIRARDYHRRHAIEEGLESTGAEDEEGS